jgi:hypothetical protein
VFKTGVGSFATAYKKSCENEFIWNKINVKMNTSTFTICPDSCNSAII